MMSTRSGRTRQSVAEASPPRTRKGVSPPRSPARNRKSSPTAGRSAPKSPSRKSPSRKPASKSPARKSPSRTAKEHTAKETKEVKETPTKSPSKRPAIKREAEVRLEDMTARVELLRTRTRQIDYSVADLPTTLPKTDLASGEKLNGIELLETRQTIDDIITTNLRIRRNAEEAALRRSSRLRDIVDSRPDIRRSFTKSLSKSVSKSVSHSIRDYSDEEDFDDILSKKDKSKSQSVTRKLATPVPTIKLSPFSDRFEFGGRLGAAVLYLLIPLTVFFILISCSKVCSYKSINELLPYKNISQWFSIPATVLVISNLLLQAIFLSIPVFGTKETDKHGKKFYFNAFFSSFCTLCILYGLDFYGVLKNETLLNSYLPMATVSYIIAVLLTLIVFLKSRKGNDSDSNPYGNSGYALYDFFIGRQIQADLLKVDIKLWIARVSNISTLLLSILIFKHSFSINLQEKDFTNNITMEELKNVLNKIQYRPTILIYSMMQMLYAIYFIIGEKKIVSTFYWNSEGLGYLQIVSSALYPYYFTSISKYIVDADLNLATNILVAASAIFLLGFFVMFASNYIKYEFRNNPLLPSLMHLDSMPTFHGKKLLVSHLWGVVRHPNYSGDILIHAALAVPGIMSRQLIAAAPAVLTILMLLHRCWRDHQRCRRRYGAAWQRYCKRVPAALVPKIL